VRSILEKQSEFQVIGEVSDGLEAGQKARELQPDLILLDINLPSLSGIEAARQIGKCTPKSKILFVSEERSSDVVQVALDTGATGYVLKTDALLELLTAVNSVLRGHRFVGSRFRADILIDASEVGGPESTPRSTVLAFPQQNLEIARRHKAGFYSHDRRLLDDFTRFIQAALREGNTAIVVATESHRDSLFPRLQAHGLDIGSAIKQGRFIPLDAAETLSRFMVNGLPDRTRFLEAAEQLITLAADPASGERRRVAVCGECDPPLWTLGDGEAAIRMEQLGNVISARYDVDVLCGYPQSGFYGEQGSRIYQQICAEHSAVYSL
jgi:DNA-binding NarL/FixJ family response regulator